MSILTLIARLSDGLLLSEEMDADGKGLEEYRNQAKRLFKTLNNKSQDRMSIETGPYYFAYLIQHEVCYLTLCEHSHPKKLVFKFLEELQKEFDIQYGAEVQGAKRPYAFIKFDTFIQRTKKVYADSKTQKNLSKVTEDLTDVHKIMSKNITEILGRGEKLNSVVQKSDELRQYSESYEKNAKAINYNMFFRKYGPFAAVALVIFLVIYIRFYYM